MIRPLTFLSLVAAAGAGLHLYGVKHEVSQLEKTLRETVRQTEAARERTGVLRAEWALLNAPDRLREASARNLPLEVMQTAQFVRLAEMERRLPPAVAFAGAPSLFAPLPGERPTAVAAAQAAPTSAPATGTGAAVVAAAGTVPRVATAVPPALPRPPAQVAAAARPLPVPPASERAPVVERAAPTAERIVAERPMPARVPPSHLPQVAGLRTPEARSAEAPQRLAEIPRPAPRPPAPAAGPAPARSIAASPAQTRLAEREVDRGMNLVNPPQPPGLLRTALHLRPTPPQPLAPSMAPPARAPQAPGGGGSLLGATARPIMAPPVPMASAGNGTMDRLR